VVLEEVPEVIGHCYSFVYCAGAKNACNSKKHLPLWYQVLRLTRITNKKRKEKKRSKREIRMESVVVDVVRFKSAGRETKNEEWMQAI
jgi:hypothetical protein